MHLQRRAARRRTTSQAIRRKGPAQPETARDCGKACRGWPLRRRDERHHERHAGRDIHLRQQRGEDQKQNCDPEPGRERDEDKQHVRRYMRKNPGVQQAKAVRERRRGRVGALRATCLTNATRVPAGARTSANHLFVDAGLSRLTRACPMFTTPTTSSYP
jgi:hypothetical protein